MKAIIFLAEGFEEIEAIAPIDILRRGGIEVITVSISNKNEVYGSHGIPVKADTLFKEIDFSTADLLCLPGGMPGTKNLDNHQELKDLIVRHANSGKNLGAICAAPSILGKLGLLNGKEAICFPGFEDQLIGAKLSNKKVVRDGNIVTAKAAGVAVEFDLKLVEILKGKLVSDQVAASIFAN
jgi:4-methyl-5(b-hydroxyethyl)-thiazole monophosphate biosynthesis